MSQLRYLIWTSEETVYLRQIVATLAAVMELKSADCECGDGIDR
jgi:hypothetical protein